jgi:hypothetical protein
MVNASSLRFRAEVVRVTEANPDSRSTLVAEIRCRNASRGDYRRARAVRQRRVPSGQEQAGQRSGWTAEHHLLFPAERGLRAMKLPDLST